MNNLLINGGSELNFGGGFNQSFEVSGEFGYQKKPPRNLFQ